MSVMPPPAFRSSFIDLRSDTVTRPTEAMREAMARANVGDDVFGEDPTVRELEAEAASQTGKDAALFVSSGTMSNQLALALHTRRGDEVIVGNGAHVMVYESGAGAALSGVQFSIAEGDGVFTADTMLERIQPAADWTPRTSLVCVENTHNRAGGVVFPQRDVLAICEAAKNRELRVHLDGARVWNASIASGLAVRDLCAPFDTVSVCFSKGLGAPVGSALCGSAEHIKQARRLRKMWGGGMRQAGIIAAGALHALHNHQRRLADDHTHARQLAERLTSVRGIRVDLARIETNIVNIYLADGLHAEAVCHAARDRGLLINATGPHRLRAVTHMNVNASDVAEAAGILDEAVRSISAHGGFNAHAARERGRDS